MNVQQSTQTKAVPQPSFTPVQTGLLQRKCACGQHTVAGGECAECRQKREETLQRAAVSSAPVTTVPPVVHDALNSPGQPLDAGTRAFMEPRFGHDFSQVRVHTDAKAAESAQAVNALAYTVGRDIVFGEGEYALGTGKGRRLMAHELTHTIQQSQRQVTGMLMADTLQVNDPGDRHEQEANRVADVVTQNRVFEPKEQTWGKLHKAPVLQRQASSVLPAPQPSSQTSSSTSGAWQNCPSNNINELNSELADAVSWVGQAITDLQNKDKPARTTGALSRYLSTDSADITNTILPKLQAILADFNQGPSNFRCQTEAECIAVFPKGAIAYSGDPITLCPGYLGQGPLDRRTTLIHEAGHNAGLAGNVIEWQWPFPGLSVSTRLGNTESYAAFVRSNRYPELAPYQQSFGSQVGVGALFSGSTASPRFLVTAEFDVVLAQRVFHFLDLHEGARIDVDSSGTFIGSLSLGTRLFSPTSLSRVPFFLDLKVGAALGGVGGTGSQDNLLFGPSGEVRVGILSGNFGGSIGYRQIWNVLKDNSDIRELTVNGEIRF